MANYIGSTKEVDHYIGENLVAAKYIGETKYFDAYSEITGIFPIIFKSRAAVALKNYRIYGTSAGAGVETESGEPHGYKLPLTITSGEQSQDISIYIGSSKLGADEYLDYGEQKVYKRTANIYDDAKTQWVNDVLDDNGQSTGGSTSSHYTDNFTRVLPEQTYYHNNAFTGTRRYYFYDQSKTWLSRSNSIGAAVKQFTTPANCAYIRVQVPMSTVSTNWCIATVSSEYIPYLQPTNPPVPFPAISTYQGENTLSSTETLGEATIKGRIKKITLVTPDLVQGSIDYSPYRIGQSGTRTSVTVRCSMQSYITIPPKSRVYISADKDDVVFSGCWTDTNLTYQGHIASGFAKNLVLENTELSNKYAVLNSIGRMLPTDKENSPTGTIAPSYSIVTFKIMEI